MKSLQRYPVVYLKSLVWDFGVGPGFEPVTDIHGVTTD